MKKYIKIIPIIVIGISLLLSCSSSNDTNNETATEIPNEAVQENSGGGQASVELTEGEDPNALQLAKSMEDFSTLVAAIEAGGVQDAVVNAGPLTIFAPLNSAFAKLPEGTVENLVQPENQATLKLILVNHVAPANYPMDQLKKEAKKERKLYMASGNYLVVENIDDEIFVGGTKVLQSVKVSNGWVHVIDDVLVPEE